MWKGLTKKMRQKKQKQKKFLPRLPSLALGEKALSRVPEQGTRGRQPLPRVHCPVLALGKGPLPRVPEKALGEVFFF